MVKNNATYRITRKQFFLQPLSCVTLWRLFNQMKPSQYTCYPLHWMYIYNNSQYLSVIVNTRYVSFFAIHSFRECLHRRHLQPADGIINCFVEAQQATIQFCEWTRVDNVLNGLLLSAITGWRWGKTPFMHVSTTWALACEETVQQCPGMAWQVETRLLDSRVAYKMNIDHSSRQPVFFPLRSLVDRSCVCPDGSE